MAARANTEPEDDDFFFEDYDGDSDDEQQGRAAKRRDGEHRAKSAPAREMFRVRR